MVEARIRQGEALAPQPALLWDSIWDAGQGFADWVVAPLGTPNNSGGLQAEWTLHTAVVICLFTWRLADPSDVIDDDDRKGWWGDAVDLEANETLIGSKLWQLRRAPLNKATAAKAVQFATEALQVLIKQGAVANIQVQALIDKPDSRLGLWVQLYSQDGTRIYDQKFASIWAQEFALAS